MPTVYDALSRRSSRVVPVREGRVSVRPSGSGSYVDIGYCRVESDEPAAITVKNAIGGRMVLGYSDRLEITWLQTSASELAALQTIQEGLHDMVLTRSREPDEGAGTESRYYLAYFLQLLPSLKDGKIKIILEKQLSVAQFMARMVIS